MIEAKVSFHGHSNHSDGLNSVETLVKEAAKLNFDYFGISDHNTTDHILPFYQAVDAINVERSHKIIPICAMEISLWHKGKRTDILFAKPGDLDLDFLKWADSLIKGRAKTIDILPIIEKAVKDFNILVVMAHPEMPMTSSATLDLLKELAQNLSDRAKKNLGVEIRNWNSNIFPKNNQREEKVAKLVKELGLAEFGLADYHSTYDIKYMYTIALVEEKTAQGLIQSVENRLVHPVRVKSATKLEMLGIANSLGRAIVRSKFLSKEMKDRMHK